jgi:hypothetical protein
MLGAKGENGMCYFMFVVTPCEIDSEAEKSASKAGLYIRDNTDMVRDRIADAYYYDINNGHCACGIASDPFDNSGAVKEVLKNLHSGGSFRFMITDTYEEEIEEYMENNCKFEKRLKCEEIQNISFREFLRIYPEEIEPERVYRVR